VKSSVAVVVPCYNEEQVLEEFHRALTEVLEFEDEYDFQVIFVDDGSRDSTSEILQRLAKADPRVEFVSLARNFGHETAMAAGLDLAETDAVVILDSDLQHPPELIPELLRQWRAGHDVVSAVRGENADGGRLKRFTSGGFYRVINVLSETEITAGASDFVLLSRTAYTALRKMPEHRRFLRGMVSWLGLPRAFVPFEAPPRFAGQSKYSLRKLFALAGDALFSFSSVPLRLATVCGLASTFAGGAYLLYVFVRLLFVGDGASAWGLLFATVLLLGGLQMLCLGIVGEYIARIHEQVQGRPHYVLKRNTITEQPAENAGSPLSEEELESVIQTMRPATPSGTR